MKNIFILLAFLFPSLLSAQVSDYKVVFDMSTRDSISQEALIREVNLIRENNPSAKMDVVVYGKGMNLVLKDKSAHTDAISKILKDPNTTFKVCAFTLKRNEVDASRLITGVSVVPDGIYEIIKKQREGWGYIKVAH